MVDRLQWFLTSRLNQAIRIHRWIVYPYDHAEIRTQADELLPVDLILTAKGMSFRAELAKVLAHQAEHTSQFAELRHGLASVRRDQAHDLESRVT